MDVQALLSQYMTNSVFILGIVLAVVTYLQQFGLAGKAQLIASLVTGIVAGAGVTALTFPPKTPQEWVVVGLFGLLTGLTASGVYNAGKAAALKGAQKAQELADKSSKG